MKRLQIFALMLMTALVCISANPVPGSLQESGWEQKKRFRKSSPNSSKTSERHVSLFLFCSSSLSPNTTQLPDSDRQNSTRWARFPLFCKHTLIPCQHVCDVSELVNQSINQLCKFSVTFSFTMLNGKKNQNELNILFYFFHWKKLVKMKYSLFSPAL